MATNNNNKFWKKKELSSLEQQIGQVLTQVEGTIPEVKNLRLSSVADFTAKINAQKQVYLVFILYPASQFILIQVKSYCLNQRKEPRQQFWKQMREETQILNKIILRTLTTVYDGLLKNLNQPSFILERQTRVRVDGTNFYRIFLDENALEGIRVKS